MASLQDTTSTAGRLIAADQVQGTTIYNPNGDNLGSVEDVMIDKVTGKIAYAVVGFGGFLGIGNRHYPLPWEKLSYDPSMGGYVVDLDRSVLEGARPTRITMRWPGTIGPGTSRSMTITARVRIGTSCRNELSCPGRDSASSGRYHDRQAEHERCAPDRRSMTRCNSPCGA